MWHGVTSCSLRKRQRGVTSEVYTELVYVPQRGVTGVMAARRDRCEAEGSAVLCQRCILSSLLSSIYTYTWTATTISDFNLKFADDTNVVCLITKGDIWM